MLLFLKGSGKPPNLILKNLIVCLCAQFDVDRVLGARTAMVFIVLATRNIQHFLVIDQFTQGDVI
ncbi:hypothetical protein D3C75_642580 [compost metagenome]